MARGPRPLTFTIEKRRRHLAHLLAPESTDKQALLRALPLFDVALRGNDALRPWSKKGKADVTHT